MGVRCGSFLQRVPGVNFGLHWVRRHQRFLTRGMLALFCAAWLQAAIVPCVMAHGGHDHPAMAAGQEAGGTSHPCPYCPPQDSDAGSTSCDGHGGCAYPHDPQVDARAAGTLFTALPVAFVAPSPGALVLSSCADPVVPATITRISLSVSYCRFIE